MSYLNLTDFDSDLINVTTIHGRNGKENLYLSYGPNHKQISFITPVCETRYPRVNGDGNLNTAYGPTDPKKINFTLDLHEADDTSSYQRFMEVLDMIDDCLLKYVFKNQAKILGRRNLSLDEIKMLQIRSAKTKIDKWNGEAMSPAVHLTTKKFYRDQCWNERERTITLWDAKGNKLDSGNVLPGDLVSASIQADNVYSGVGGDKFGVHWTFNDVCIVCQSMNRNNSVAGEAFASQFESHPLGREYSEVATIS